MAKHDHSYKLLFSHPRMVQDLLTGFVKEPWVRKVNFSTLERCSGTYVSADLREREDDMVWRVRWGREWVYLYLLLEFQSTVDPFMAVRVMTYVGLLYQDLIRRQEVKKGWKLPVVLPLVLYNGERPWTAPLELEAQVQKVSGELARYCLPVRYMLLEERRYPARKLRGSPNLVALLFRLEQSRTVAEIVEAIGEFEPWLRKKELEDIQRAMAVWVHQVILPSRGGDAMPPAQSILEVRSMLAERMRRREQKIESRALAKGREEGRKEGWEKGRLTELRVVIVAALEARFQRIPAAVSEAIEAVHDVKRLEAMHREAVLAKSVKDFAAKLAGR